MTPDNGPDMKAIPTKDQSAVILVKGRWRLRVPVAEYPTWVNLYRRLRDREGGRFARFYIQSVEAMEAAAKALGIAVPVPKQAGAKK